MSFFNSKALMRNQLRHPANEWSRDTGAASTQQFYGRIMNSQIWTGEFPLSAGDVVHRYDEPSERFLILYTQDRGPYFAAEYSKVTHTAIHKRLDPGAGRDSFGRSTASELATLGTVPLSLIDSTSKDDTTKDRAANLISYTFSAPARCDIKKHDLIAIGGEVLQVRTLLLSSNRDITEFTATATQ